MLPYTIENYKYYLTDKNDPKKYLGNDPIYGYVTNSDDDSFVIPIFVDNESRKDKPKPHPYLMGKFDSYASIENDPRLVPWIIRCDINDIKNLRKGQEEYIVALYHEIGHFHYMDEQDPNFDDKKREALLRQGKISKEETQADSVAAIILGKDKVLAGSNRVLSATLMDPEYGKSEAGNLFITELRLRIKAL